MALKSWLHIPKSSHFSLANIPFGIISTPAETIPRPAVAIGEHVLDLKTFAANGGFSSLEGIDLSVFAQSTLNAFAALGRPIHSKVRRYIQDVFIEETPHASVLKNHSSLRAACLIPQNEVKMHLPMYIRDYTDFFVGKHHAYNCGCLFRDPKNALQPNYTHLPVGYHGRASSIVVSGTPIRRPKGQIIPNPQDPVKKPILSSCKRLDYELELGAFLCKENTLGTSVPISEAAQHLFGLVMLNDLSARDIQTWEYVPLGPFNAKNFGSSISPWVVLMDALEPFSAAGIPNETEILDYMREDKKENVYDIRLEIEIIPNGSDKRMKLAESNGKHLLFSFPQMVAHHTVGGCNLNVGDLLGSGTISGPDAGTEGSLLELSNGGKQSIKLDDGVERKFLEDGDTVIFTGVCGTEETGLVGFGTVETTLLPTAVCVASSQSGGHVMTFV